MNSKEFIASGILETYALGQATTEEARLVEQMVMQFPEVKDELNAIELALQAFDFSNAVEPPAELREKILSKAPRGPAVVRGTGKVRRLDGADHWGEEAPEEENTSVQSNAFFKYAAGVAFLALIVSAWYNYKLNDEVKEKERDVLSAENLRDMYKREWDYYDSMNLVLNHELAVLKTPAMKSIELKGMELAPDAKAMAYANSSNGDVYLEIVNLPPAPEGMQYQFWGFVDGKPVDAGMIPLEGDLSGIHAMKTIPGSTGYAITLETKGGHQLPEGKIYVMGNV